MTAWYTYSVSSTWLWIRIIWMVHHKHTYMHILFNYNDTLIVQSSFLLTDCYIREYGDQSVLIMILKETTTENVQLIVPSIVYLL